MSQPMPDGQNRVELSAELRAALQRAHGYALQQSHRFITVEHVLLALNEDPDAALILEACNVDQAQLHAEISGHLGHDDNRFADGETVQPVMDPEASRIINSAVAASQKSGRSVVNGAIVLAAIIGDGRSAAAHSLRTQGLTFEAAITALQQGVSAAAARSRAALEQEAPVPSHHTVSEDRAPDVEADDEPMPAAPPAHVNGAPPAASGATEDLLADARKRVEALRKAQSDQRTGRQAPPAEPEAPPEPSDERDAAVLTEPLDRPRTPLQPTPGRPAPPQDTRPHQDTRPPPADEPPAQDPARRLQERLRDQAAAARGIGGHPFDDSDERARRPQAPGPQGQTPPQGRLQPQPGGYPQQPRPSPQPRHPQHGPAAAAPGGTRPLPRHPGGDDDRISRPVAPRPAAAAPHPGQPPTDPRLGPFAVGGGPAGVRAPDAPMPQRPPHQGAGGVPPASSQRVDPDEASVGDRGEETTRGRQTSVGVGAGQLHENIPRKMRAWVPCRVEIRIARAEISNVSSGMTGAAPPVRHDIGVTKAMSVRLRAPEGGFFIEQISPETQWIESQIGLLNDEFASWRWTVTPTRRGKARLQLIVSARTVGADGLAAESALPDQVVDVTVSVNYVRMLTVWGGWIAAAIVGGLLAKFGEGVWALGTSLLG